jgi:SAM-dependent methyltransferase
LAAESLSERQCGALGKSKLARRLRIRPVTPVSVGVMHIAFPPIDLPVMHAEQRARPAIWRTDWLVLKPLAETLQNWLAEAITVGARVVDFGCGEMPYRTLVESHGGVYLGADLGAGAHMEIASDGALPFSDGSADIVLSIQVLEHVANIDQYLREAHRVLKVDGALILSTHGSWLYHPHPADYRRWTRAGLELELSSRGFIIKDVRPIAGPLATTIMIRLTAFSQVIRRAPVVGRMLANVLAVFSNLRAILEDYLTPQAVRAENASVYVMKCAKS